MSVQTEFQYLERRPGSSYKQLFIKDRRIRAEVIYRETVRPEAMPPEQVAEEYEIPLEAVQEAIDYCIKNKALLDEERAREEADIKRRGLDKWPYAPKNYNGSP